MSLQRQGMPSKPNLEYCFVPMLQLSLHGAGNLRFYSAKVCTAVLDDFIVYQSVCRVFEYFKFNYTRALMMKRGSERKNVGMLSLMASHFVDKPDAQVPVSTLLTCVPSSKPQGPFSPSLFLWFVFYFNGDRSEREETLDVACCFKLN